MIGGMGLRILSGDRGSGHTPVLVSSGAVGVALLISTGDPFDLAGLEVRAHGEREDHRVGCERMNCSTNEGAGTNGVNTPTTKGTHQHQRVRSGRSPHSRCGSHPPDRVPMLPSRQYPMEWFRCWGWCNSGGFRGRWQASGRCRLT